MGASVHYVYGLAHHCQPRMKIGITANLLGRVDTLGAGQTDLGRSVAIATPDWSTARSVELTLHEAFREWRLPREAVVNTGADPRRHGVTEWFSRDCLEAARLAIAETASTRGFQFLGGKELIDLETSRRNAARESSEAARAAFGANTAAARKRIRPIQLWYRERQLSVDRQKALGLSEELEAAALESACFLLQASVEAARRKLRHSPHIRENGAVKEILLRVWLSGARDRTECDPKGAAKLARLSAAYIRSLDPRTSFESRGNMGPNSEGIAPFIRSRAGNILRLVSEEFHTERYSALCTAWKQGGGIGYW